MTNDELRRHLLGVGDEFGAMTPEVVVQAARPDDHPLHPYFTWEDVDAAEKFRLWQARQLIARVRVEVTVSPKKVVRVRGFTSVPVGGGERVYMPVTDVASDPDLSRSVIEEMRAEVAALRRRYAAHEALFRQVLAEALDAA